MLREKALDAKLHRDASTGSDDETYAVGRLMAYHEIVSLMQSQAEAFGLNLADIALDKIDAEQDLL